MFYDDKRLPDHPVIQNMEAFGTPDGKPESVIRCPVCGREGCNYIYSRAIDGERLGCDLCIDEVAADDDPACFSDDAYDWRPDCYYDDPLD